MNLDVIRDHIRRTDARLTAAEKAQKQQKKARKRFQKQNEPIIEALEDAAAGFVRAQELSDTHALKRRVANLQRQAAGYIEPPTDYEAAEFRHAQDVAQRTLARNQAELDAHKNADRQARWNVKRAEILRARARQRRAAEEQGTGWLDVTGELPLAAPDYWEAEPDSVKVTHHTPSLPTPVLNPDGTRTLAFGHDVISGQPPSERLLTAEEKFKLEAEGR